MKQILMLALALLSFMTMQAQTYWNGTSDKTFSGSGTQTDPYLIGTPEQLAGLAELCNDPDDPNDFAGKYIKLTSDIYLTDFNNPDTAAWLQWEPIGHYVRQGFENGFAYSRYFRGHFDGDGHTIYNMYYKGDVDWGGDINLDPYDWENNNMEELENLTWDSWYRGLFCFLEGTAENITVADARLAGIYVAPFAHQVGENAVVRNCHVQNPYMYATQGSNYGFVQDNYGLIENSSVQVNLIGRYNSYGFAGTNHESGIIRDCHANVSSDSYFCAPVAYINQGLIERTHTTVDITSDHAMMASGFVYSNQNQSVIRECSSSGTVRGLGNAPRTAQWSGQIAGFCIINTGLIESSWTTCDMVRIDGEYSYDMAGFVLANGYNGSGIQYDGIPGNAINCFTAGTLTFSSEDITSGLHPFLQQYNGTSGTPSTPYYSPSRQLNCFWTREGTPQVTNLSHYWAGEEVTLAQLQSQAFVDTLNMIARFMGTSQWEYLPGQLPRPTGVYILDKTVFFAQGSGTETDPYLVSNKTELEHLAWLVNKGYDFRNEYLKQTADIELNAPESEWSEVAPTKWTTIGKNHTSSYFSVSYPLYFDGSYDGDFHEVKNLYINDPSGSQGLFGNVGSSHGGGGEYGMPQEQYYIRPAVLRNLGVTGVYIRATQAGAIAGGLGTKANLIQCWSSGKIYAASAYSQLAGLSGSIYMHSCILNSKTSVALYPISSTGSGELRSFSGEVGGSQIDTIVNALYTGAYQSSQQREPLYAFSASANGGMYKNVYRDSTLSPQNAGWDGTYLYSTQQMQSKELVNILNTTVMEWNDIHGAGEQLDYWKWQENDYPVISRDTVGLFHKVTFESNGGDSISPMCVMTGSQITAPTRPTKSGYLFHAWYRDEALTDFFDFKRDSVTSNMTLYAKWIVDTRGDYDLSPFLNEFATTYHIKTAAQLRGLAVAQMGIYDWTNYNIATNEGTKTTVTAPMDFTGKTIVLDNDIFLNDTADWKLWGNHCYAIPWTPIGQNIPKSGMDISFKGTFDGQGHVVYGLYCEMGTTVAGYTDRYDSQFGLFACLNGGTVRNVGVEASVIDLRKHDDAPLPYEAAGSASTQKGISIYGNRAGMLIGKLHMGTVEQCFAKGRIIPHEKDPMYADISDSYLGGLISSVEGTIGNRTSGSVSNCYAQVDIIREQYDDAKGYAIIGSGVSKNDHYCEVTFANCYGVGICSQGNNIATTYYNKDLVVKPAANTSAKSTYEMHTMNAYANWDFDNIWARNDTVNDGYPVLRIFHPGIENSPEPITVTGITLQETSVDIMIGDSIQLHASVVPEDAANQNITWSSNKPTIAPVDENGFVRVGIISYTTTVVITATTEDGNYAKKCTLNIKIPNINNYYPAVLKSRRIGDAEWQEGKDANAKYTLNWEYIVGAYTTQPLSYAPFAWQSSDESVLTVSSFKDDTTIVSSGNTYRASLAVVQCVGEGTATVTVANPKYDGISAQRTYTVLQYNPTSMAINENYEHVVEVGDVNTLTVTTEPAATSFVPEIIWSTDAPNVVAVNENGVVEALAAGTATVTATCGTLTASVTFTVNAVEVELTSIALSEDSVFLYEGETVQMVVVPTPANALLPAVTWTSNKPSFATVDRNTGLVTAIRKGSARITAYAGSLSASCVVTVESDTYYTITFVNYDGTELQSSQVLEGETPVYTGTTLVRLEDDTYTYEFSGWYPVIVPATANTTYTAQYTATQKTVSECENVSGSWLQTGGSGLGEITTDNTSVWTYNSSYGAVGKKQGGYTAYLMTPAKNLNGMQTVTLAFNHAHRYASNPSDELTLWMTPDYKGSVAASQWQQLTISPYASNTNWTFVNVTINVPVAMVGANTVFAFKYKSTASAYATWEIKNLTLTAVCAGDTPQPEYYTIRFLNWNNTVLQSSQVKEGTMPAYSGAAPTRAEDDNYTYTFSGWSPTIVAVTEDADYTAQFTATPIPQPVYYTIRFLNYDGSELQSTQVPEGESPVYTGTTPTKPEDDNFTYEFSGWSPAILPASSDADYTAQFTATKKSQGFEDVQSDDVQCTKVLINGTIYILRGDKIYNAQGALVK